ncbi:MAG TPA: YebC/PmpR family DNA-binding transcriptional regulator [Oligoflexia bacterium]|nr:YebC/PmpR family DNA-binding transcriptional regulator [Oligoflexia bacterium]HMP47853.1 YebC/PmpR family DNA-binding transcriptional regulator [Oligoflexia bacterium]
MGRIFEKRKARMFARWSKNAKAFTKLGKEIAIAVRLGGPDPAGNPRLRMAMQTAKSLNMPKDRVENAIHRASSKDAEGIEEITYEGYGPHGVAIFIEAATNNNTRTVANVRNVISKNGGNLGTDGSLSFLFKRVGVFTIKNPAIDPDGMELELIDYGLEELFETEEGNLSIQVDFSMFGEMQKFLEQKGFEVVSAGAERIPLNTTTLDASKESEVLKLVNALEEDDDVQHVYHNLKLSEDGE